MASNKGDIITDWLVQNEQVFSEPADFFAFNSYLISEFGVEQSTEEKALIKRYALLRWLEFHKQGFVCIEMEDILDSGAKMTELYHQIGGPTWDKEALIDVLSDLSFTSGFESFELEDGRLYMKRHLSFENEIVNWLENIAYSRDSFLPNRSISELTTNEYIDWIAQEFSDLDTPKKRILAHLFSMQFLIVTGGPGTGKTFTLERIMKAYQSWHPELKIQLAAPTGKAAKRMNESIDSSLLDVYGEAKTIHRMLGARHDGRFSKGVKNRLISDVVIIDEASMIDIDLFIQVVRALKDGAQLILVGDHFQLDSVEAGNILGDLCTHQPEENKACYGVFELETNYRQESNSSIPALSEAIKGGDWEVCRKLLLSDEFVDVEWWGFNSNERTEREAIKKRVIEFGKHGFTAVKQQVGALNEDEGLGKEMEVELELESLESYSLLGAVRRGWLGVETINALVDTQLRSEILGASKNSDNVNGPWYLGRPIMIRENDAGKELFNGDMGICSSLYPVCIRFDTVQEGQKTSVDGSNNGVEAGIKLGGKEYPASSLPSYDLGYALTIHKSQGSEYDHVCVILSSADSLLHTRELLYTAVTRARKKITIVATEEQLKKAVSTTKMRRSGLQSKLQ
jgi:exodeoxyribonuclease V alpha subunit